MPTGVRMPVDSMSSRPLMGMVHAFEMPGSSSAAFISSMSFASSMPGRHALSGLRTMVVSIMVNGAGSVDVLARPALPKTRSTSGNVRRILSCTCNAFCASATDMPGSTADGM